MHRHVALCMETPDISTRHPPNRSVQSRVIAVNDTSSANKTIHSTDTAGTHQNEDTVLVLSVNSEQSRILTMAQRHVLVLPFDSSTYPDPAPLLPTIHETLTSLPTDSTHFTVLLITPDDSQLYLTLRSSPVSCWNDFQGSLSKLYACLAAAQWSCGKVLLDVEVAFEGEAEFNLKDLEVIVPEGQLAHRHRARTSSDFAGFEHLLPPSAKAHRVIKPIEFHSDFRSACTNDPSPEAGPQVVALGGTFDHLHAAHKLLLHLAYFIASRKVIVGVMAESLLSSKSNSHLIQPLQRRISDIESFLLRRGGRRKDETSLRNVEFDVVEIADPFGPTSWNPDIHALVVSRETFAGGAAVNARRKENKLPKLELFVIDVIASTIQHENSKILDLSGEMDEKKLKELKMGSTGIRQWIAEHKS